MAIKVALREKSITKGRNALYLDIYPAVLNHETGKTTRREFLKLYVIDEPRNPIDKQYNTEQKKIAESIRKQRENFYNKPEIYNEFEKEQLRIKANSEKSFTEYFERLADKRTGTNSDNWYAALNYLKKFNAKLNFGDLNERVLEDFKEFLLTVKSARSNKTTLSQNSAQAYFNKVKASLRQAYNDGLLKNDLNTKIQPIKAEETRRVFLTLEELNKLVQTSCNNPLLKSAALFSALTGLRHSDIKKMKWSELEYVAGQGYFLNFSQQKTKGVEVLPISEQAYNLLGEPGKPDAQVFDGLTYSAYQNKHLFQWIGAAGITKDITFHSFRHTYATLQLHSGTDIYTVSKMLGHKDLKTTQIYAKVVDDAKRETTNKIKLDF